MIMMPKACLLAWKFGPSVMNSKTVRFINLLKVPFPKFSPTCCACKHLHPTTPGKTEAQRDCSSSRFDMSYLRLPHLQAPKKKALQERRENASKYTLPEQINTRVVGHQKKVESGIPTCRQLVSRSVFAPGLWSNARRSCGNIRCDTLSKGRWWKQHRARGLWCLVCLFLIPFFTRTSHIHSGQHNHV